MIHQRSGIVVAEGELTQSFEVVTTELDENLVVESLPRLDALTIAVGGGNDVVDCPVTRLRCPRRRRRS